MKVGVFSKSYGRSVVLTFLFYTLSMVSLGFWFQDARDQALTAGTVESASPVITLLQMLGRAAANAGRSLSYWLNFIAISVALNFAFFVAIKYVTRARTSEILYVFLLSISISLLATFLLDSILSSLMGAYYSVTLIFLLVTYIITRRFVLERF